MNDDRHGQTAPPPRRGAGGHTDPGPPAPPRFDAFVSAVTSECGKARDAVAAELRKLDLRVAVQSDFRHGPAGVTTLRKLHDIIRGCAEVHCIIGTRSGACPPPDAAAPFSHLLPDGITEASYTQWEYFFALHTVPHRLFLYLATDAYQPDQPASTGSDRPDLQQRFVAHLRRVRGDDYAPFANAGEVRAEVLAHLAARRRADGAADAPLAGHTAAPEPFHRGVAVNAIGSFIAGMLLLALGWLVTPGGGDREPTLLPLILLTAVGGGVAFFVIFQRYAAILGRQGPDERDAYDRLRHNLAVGGLAAETYARRLTAALNAVDRFFGDDWQTVDGQAGSAGRSLWPHAFGLRAPAPLWTAPAFDRCLLLALIYPVATILLVWALSGHVGPAEHALGLGANVAGWRRGGMVAGLGVMCYGLWRFQRTAGWRSLVWLAVAGAGAVAVAVAGAGAGAIAGAIVVAVAGAVAGAVAVAVAGAVAVAVAIAVAGAGAIAIAGAVAIAIAVAFAFAVDYINQRAARERWQGPFQAGLLVVLILACLAGSFMLARQAAWPRAGPLLLFLGLLTLVNAPFDWASLGLTRALLRRGLERGAWWPYVLALLDALVAATVIALLTVATVLAVQSFDTLAAFGGGAQARILPLDALFNGIAARPAAPEFWWIYALLLSTMVPSLVNLTIGGASLLRGVPWVTALLLRNLPEHRAPPGFERSWMTLLLTLQVFLGGLFGIAAQGFLAYAVIGWALPWFGLDLLSLARGVAAADLPRMLLAWLTGAP